MAMQTDILASAVRTDDGVVNNQAGDALGRVRIKGVYIVPSGTAGSVVFKDGGASGTTRLTFNIPVTAAFAFSTVIPGEGILFNTDVHVTLPTSAKITVFYG